MINANFKRASRLLGFFAYRKKINMIYLFYIIWNKFYKTKLFYELYKYIYKKNNNLIIKNNNFKYKYVSRETY